MESTRAFAFSLCGFVAAVSLAGGCASPAAGPITAGTGGASGGAGGSGTGGSSVGGGSGGAATGGQGGVDAAMDAPMITDAPPGGEPAGDRGGVTGAGCTAAGAICWDFEDGTLPAGWTAYRNEFAGTLLVDATRAHGGTHALHASNLVGGVEGQQGGPKKTMRFSLPDNFGPTLWGRAFVYTTPARPNSHAGIFNARYPPPGMTATATIDKLDWYEVATYTQKYMTVWHPPEPPGYPEWVQVSDTPLVLDNWACLEWLFDGANGANPQAADPRLWVNGAEQTWPAPFVFSDPATTVRPTQEKAQTFTVLEVGAYLYQGLPTATNWWIDDLAVARERIGCN
ncbi:MAG TPA: hypothetical protein VGL59_01030 [Polyangia bacterium]